MNGKLSDIARQLVSDLKTETIDATQRFHAPIYIAIKNSGEMEESGYPYILDTGDIAVIILPYSYTVITQRDKSANVAFIDERGIPSDKISKNGWTLTFDEPKSSLYRTYVRTATISNEKLVLKLPVNPEIGFKEMRGIWEAFLKSQSIDSLEGLKLVGELYNNSGFCPSSYYVRACSV